MVTGVLQGYRSSTMVYGFSCTTWLQELYRFIVVLQYYYRGPGIVQGYRCSGVVGVHRYRNNTLV